MSETLEIDTPVRRGPKVLTLDIETAPATALVFGQWKQDIANVQVVKQDRVIGIGAKWLHEDKVMWRSEYHHGKDVMVKWIRDLLNEADIVVHFNGGTFDMPWIWREIAVMGLTPPAPVREIDLLKVVKKRFRFMSNKLEAIVQWFGVGEKMKHTGFQLWRDIEVGDEVAQRKAWAIMRRYCKQDVKVEEDLYLRLLPYISNHPHVGLYADLPAENSCANCGSEDLQNRGYQTTKVGKYRRYQCQGCGAWGRYKKALALVDARSA